MIDRENKLYYKGMIRILCNKGIKIIGNKIYIYVLW